VTLLGQKSTIRESITRKSAPQRQDRDAGEQRRLRGRRLGREHGRDAVNENNRSPKKNGMKKKKEFTLVRRNRETRRLCKYSISLKERRKKEENMIAETHQGWRAHGTGAGCWHGAVVDGCGDGRWQRVMQHVLPLLGPHLRFLPKICEETKEEQENGFTGPREGEEAKGISDAITPAWLSRVGKENGGCWAVASLSLSGNLLRFTPSLGRQTFTSCSTPRPRPRPRRRL
jgi:hypothetical protein